MQIKLTNLFFDIATRGPPVASSSSIPFPDADADIERMRLQALGNPSLMNDLREVRERSARAEAEFSLTVDSILLLLA